MHAVTVIGLGAMGAAIARLFLDNGRTVTVWNRTPEKAASLVAAGARLADSAADAVAAGDLVVMCVYDYAAVDAVLDMPGVSGAVAGKLLVQLTTGSPEDARNTADWARRHGARYLDGAIQAAPSQMGLADTPILISGDVAAFGQAQPLLRDLAGNYVLLGDRADAAAAMDLATLSYVYGAFIGFVQGAVIAESQGQDAARLGQLVADISPGLGAFFAHEGNVIRSGEFAISESPLRISVEATRRIDGFARRAGLYTGFSALAARLFEHADRAGLGNQEAAALIEVMREPALRRAT